MPEAKCGNCGHSGQKHPLRHITRPYTGQPDTTTACRAIVGVGYRDSLAMDEERCDCPEYVEVYE